MRHFILIFILVGHLQVVTGQTSERHDKFFTPKGDPTCFYTPKYSATKRNQFYPFNIADTIKLVSFRYHRNNYPVEVNKVVYDSLIEIKTLTKAAVDTLTDILYNNFYKQQPNYGYLAQCFFPRDAILFVDRFGQLKAYILLCFHCDQHKESSDKVSFGDECTQKMEKLRQFFAHQGVQFGTDNTIDSYAGETGNTDVIAPSIQN